MECHRCPDNPFLSGWSRPGFKQIGVAHSQQEMRMPDENHGKIVSDAR